MGSRLYVGNLSFNSDTESVRQAFSEVGEVTDVHVVMDRETGRSRGFAFVTMASDQLASEAISRLDGATLDGRALRVNEAEERKGGGGGGGGRGFGGGGGGGGGYGGGGGGGGGRRGGGGGGRDRDRGDRW
jgi:RNA recognition motif-containing protein